VAGGLSLERVTAGSRYACAESTSNRAYCWGDNSAGQLGVGTFQNSTTPTQVLGGLFFRQLSAGYRHVCGKTPSGVLYCWGAGGALGNGEFANQTTPTPVSDPS
jgi:alpha-tubulin suppressor-like RCC1 family protein